MINRETPLVIGIAGGSGSGKTTVSQVILERVGADRIAFFPHDAYYRDLRHLSIIERAAVNFDHPDSLETELLIEQIIDIRSGKTINLPVYDFTTHSRTLNTIQIEYQPIIIVEGILIFVESELRDLFEIKNYSFSDPDIRFIRRLERDISERDRTMVSVIEQYQKTVRPMHLEFVEPSKRYADVIIPEGGHNVVALDMVIARIEELLQSEGI